MAQYAGSNCDLVLARAQRTLALTHVAVNKCGSDLFPWRLRAEPGQRLNVTLLDFGNAAAAASSATKAGAEGDENSAAETAVDLKRCRHFGRVVEPGIGRTTEICGKPNVRESHVELSQSSLVEVIINRSNNEHFLLIISGQYQKLLSAEVDTRQGMTIKILKTHGENIH